MAHGTILKILWLSSPNLLNAHTRTDSRPHPTRLIKMCHRLSGLPRSVVALGIATRFSRATSYNSRHIIEKIGLETLAHAQLASTARPLTQLCIPLPKTSIDGPGSDHMALVRIKCTEASNRLRWRPLTHDAWLRNDVIASPQLYIWPARHWVRQHCFPIQPALGAVKTSSTWLAPGSDGQASWGSIL